MASSTIDGACLIEQNSVFTCFYRSVPIRCACEKSSKLTLVATLIYSYNHDVPDTRLHDLSIFPLPTDTKMLQYRTH